jgi:hypothetical protein
MVCTKEQSLLLLYVPHQQIVDGPWYQLAWDCGVFQVLVHLSGRIPMTNDVLHYITIKDRMHLKQLEKCKTKEQKKNRLKRKFLSATTDEAKAKKERENRAGTYKSGINMADGNVDGYTEEELLKAAATKPKARKPLQCHRCGGSGHATTRSKKCKYYGVPDENIPPLPAKLDKEGNDDNDVEEDGEVVSPLDGAIANAARNSLAYALRDTANYDSYPLTDEVPDDISLSAFQECEE